jgi:cytochrome c-type biogenesis protein CcmF
MLLANNVLLVAAVSVVFIGTVYPIALSAMGTRISVGAPYFETLFAPVFVALLVLVPFGPRLAWRRGDFKEALRVLSPALGLAALAAAIVLAFATPRSLAGALAFALAAWLIAASVIDLMRRGRWSAIPAGAFAAALAHAGLGVTLMGIAGTTIWKSEDLEVLAPGDTMTIAGTTLRFRGVEKVEGPNYFASRATLDVMDGNAVIATLHPEQRLYPAEQSETVNTAIRTNGFRDLYVALGDQRDGGRWTVRAYVNPLAPLIWLGGGVMALGGLLSLIGRLRGARLARSAVSPAPAE